MTYWVGKKKKSKTKPIGQEMPKFDVKTLPVMLSMLRVLIVLLQLFILGLAEYHI